MQREREKWIYIYIQRERERERERAREREKEREGERERGRERERQGGERECVCVFRGSARLHLAGLGQDAVAQHGGRRGAADGENGAGVGRQDGPELAHPEHACRVIARVCVCVCVCVCV